MLMPFGLEIGKKYSIYHVTPPTLEISTYVSEFKIIHVEEKGNGLAIECEPVRKAKHKPEKFTLDSAKLDNRYVLHPRLKDVGETF